MEKILAILLSLSFVLCLTACNKDEVSSDVTSDISDGVSQITSIESQTGDSTETSKPTKSSKPMEPNDNGGSQTTGSDKNAPVVNSFTIDKTSVKMGDVVNITMKITDDSEISSCRVVFRMSNGKEGNAWTDLQKDCVGIFRGEFPIDATFLSGKCEFAWFQVVDVFSNSLLVSDGYNDVWFEVL